jgi:PKD repeat protein
MGGLPYHVSAGHFNSDNFLDFAVVSGLDNSVRVFLGNGAGSYSAGPGSPYTVGSLPRTIAVGDLNNDGFQDMVVANYNSNNLHVLLGSASGLFANAAGSPITAGSGPFQCVVTDFNMNGSLDIAVCNWGTSNVSVFFGNGTGSFNQATGSPINCGNGPHPMCIGDFNGNSMPDLAVGDWSGNSVTILINTLSPPCNLVAGFSSSAGTNSYSFQSTSTGTVAGTTYSWDFGDGSPSATGANVMHNYSNTGMYTVTLTASNNATPACTSTFTQAVSACNIVAGFNYTMIAPGNFSFQSISTGTMPGTTYAWYFGNGSFANAGPSVTYSYATTGTYTVNLMVTTSNPACTSLSSAQVVVLYTFIPGESRPAADLSVYPNPFTEELQVICTEKMSWIIITDVSGRVICDSSMDDLKYSGNLTCSPGIYFISVYGAEKQLLATRKILRN